MEMMLAGATAVEVGAANLMRSLRLQKNNGGAARPCWNSTASETLR